jgi:hypothetical protein
MTKFTKEFNEGYKRHSNTEKPIYINFAASKISDRVKPNTYVEYKCWSGKVYRVACRNNTETRKAMVFFGILKAEATKINQIISSYPVRFGKVEKRFLPAVKKELRAIGLGTKAIKIVLG